MKITINFKRLYLYILLIMAFMNTGLRFSEESALSLFRVNIVFFGLLILLPKVKQYKNQILFMLGIGFYSIILIFLRAGSFEDFVDHYIHWGIVFIIYTIVKELSKSKNFNVVFYKFLDAFTVFSFFLYAIENYTGIHLFEMAQKNVGPNIFYWNVNELASAIIIMGIIYIVKAIRKRNIFCLIKAIIVMLILTNEGCRADMIVMIVATVIALLINYGSYIIKNRKLIMISSVPILCLGLLILYVVNPTIDNASIQELIFEPLFRILNDDISYEAGSINVRMSAIIVGINNLYDSFGFGVGIGNSVTILREYHFYELLSMHNIIIQVIVEIGWMAIFPLIGIIRNVFHDFSKKITDYNIVKLIVVCLGILIAAQSSTGILSNYTFWTILFFLFMRREEVIYETC